MARKNLTFHLAERPKGDIVPGKTFNLVETDAPTANDLKDGEVLVENIYLSLDPAMRTWLYDVRSYTPPVAIGEKMRGGCIARVLASKGGKVKEGDYVFVWSGWTEVAVVAEDVVSLIDLPKGTRLTDAIGAAGPTGLTAYFGLRDIGKPKAGETVVVSGAAGATGSVAGQIAKIHGARVIGIAGSDEKCKVLTEELGFDVALNYKSPTFKEDFAKATPDFIDVYWDNVGGEILDLALSRAATHARFVMCGSISRYNALEKAPGVRNIQVVTTQRVRMEGFIVTDYLKEFSEAKKQLSQWIVEGKLKRKETIVKGGLKVAETAISNLFNGGNMGKLLVEVKPIDQNNKKSLL
ncbi:NAD(P)-binding protein [Rostrohypoxylon terebratum]|nr:NAD(P)-binding protein [Rostrohypoxylon terebratum]